MYWVIYSIVIWTILSAGQICDFFNTSPDEKYTHICYTHNNFIGSVITSNDDRVMLTGEISRCSAEHFRDQTLDILSHKKKGDKLEFYFKSYSGNSESAAHMEKTIQIAIEHGVQTTCVAGPVIGGYALDPYMVCHKKVGNKDSRFKIDPIKLSPHVPFPGFVTSLVEDYWYNFYNVERLVELSKNPEMGDKIRKIYYEDRVISTDEMIELGLVDEKN